MSKMMDITAGILADDPCPPTEAEMIAGRVIQAGARAMAEVLGSGAPELAHALTVKLWDDLVAMAEETIACGRPEPEPEPELGTCRLCFERPVATFSDRYGDPLAGFCWPCSDSFGA